MSKISLIIFYEILLLLLAGAILAHASFRLFRIFKAKENLKNLGWIPDAVWFLISAYVLTLWPQSTFPEFYPRPSFLFFSAIVVFLTTVAQGWDANSIRTTLFKIGTRVLLIVASFVVIFSAVRFLINMRPIIMGPDFFYYIVTSRHMASGLGDIDFIRYCYLPGVYTFWRSVFRLTDGSLDSLQWAHLSVLVANALLVGGIVYRILRNSYAAVISVIWYVVFCSRFEGFYGVTEPIATLPILIGMLLWGGKTLMGRQGLFRIVALGVGLGLGVYIRQHAGLVSLGATSLLITVFVRDRENPIINIKRLFLLAAIATTVLLGGIALEGFGLQPLVLGLQVVPAYGMEPNSWKVLWKYVRLAALISSCSVLAMLIWLTSLVIPRFRPVIVQPWFQMLGFTCVAGFVSLITFLSRPYAHYALISGPFLIICSTIAVVVIGRSIPMHFRKTPAFYFLVILLALLPFVRGEYKAAFYAWPVERVVKPYLARPWHLEPGHAADLKFMKQQLRPMEYIYVLPPSQNEIHFFLGSRNSFYGWFEPVPLEKVLQSPGLQGVIVMKREALDTFYLKYAVKMFQYDQAEEILKRHQYKPVVKLSTMVLWRKTSFR